MITLEEAIDNMVTAFCQGRSRTHPYLSTFQHGLWTMKDGPGKKGPARKEEVMVVGGSPRETVAKIAELNLGWHFLCAVDPPGCDERAICEAYKSLGYRKVGTEWVYVHDLREVPTATSHPPVRWIRDAETHASIRQMASQPRRFRTDGRMFCIWDEESDRGWVSSIPIGRNSVVSDLYVYEHFRSRGYGRALMCALLQDDKALGFENSVLTASSAGARLYPKVGYELIGIMQVFCPRVRR